MKMSSKLNSKLLYHVSENKLIMMLLGLIILMITFFMFTIIFSGTMKHKFVAFLTSSAYSDSYVLPERFVHLDLKGAPPKVTYLKRLFPLLSKLGATGLLIEYEDTFPYDKSLCNISALNAYSRKDVQNIQIYALNAGLSLIPIVQTFGHLEFALKLAEFRELREVPELPQGPCPSKDASLVFIYEMINQVLEAHPKVTRIHIGINKVRSLVECGICSTKRQKLGWNKHQLFLNHITAISKYIRINHPRIRTILMWDDIFRDMSVKVLKKNKIGSIFEPVVWEYTPDVNKSMGGDKLWNVYKQVFNRIWIGSAFKGASEGNEILTNVSLYWDNHQSWQKVIAMHCDQIDFAGVIITGWSRFDHFAVLCELLPVGLPSLAICLNGLLNQKMDLLKAVSDASKHLKCEYPYELIDGDLSIPECSYPGADVLDSIVRLQQLRKEFAHMKTFLQVKGWLNKYNIKHEFSNPYRVHQGTGILTVLRNNLKILKNNLDSSMEKVYNRYTIDEWKETHFEPLFEEVENLWNARSTLLSKRVWPRRPLK